MVVGGAAVRGGTALAAAITLQAHNTHTRTIHTRNKQGVFSVGAFTQAMVVLGLSSSELMAACGALGTMAGMGRPFLAATVMAMGNSLQDLVSNVTVAASGFPLIAITACMAAPLFNMLAGLGLGTALRTARFGTMEQFPLRNDVLLLFAAHALLLARLAVEVPLLHRWRLPRGAGLGSLVAYASVLLLFVLTSLGVIWKEPWPM